MRLFSLLIAALLTLPLLSQPVELSVERIEETCSLERSGSYSPKVEIKLELKGMTVNKANQVQIEGIDYAVDDLGTEMKWIESGMFDDDFSSSPSISLSLTPGKRQATEIEEIRGNISVFRPSVESGSLLDVTDFEQLLNTDLFPNSADDFHLILVDRVLIDSLKGKQGEDYTKAVERLRARGQAVPDLTRAIGGEGTYQYTRASDLFSMFGYAYEDNPDRYELNFIFWDPTDKLVSIEVYDAENKKQTRGSSSSNTYLQIPLLGTPQPDWKLVITVRTDASLEKVPFTLRGVKLP
ncbi:MAG: hypothetical protein WBA17_13415 [Saprospiraceae bacterium]